MPDTLAVIGAMTAGALCSGAVFAAGQDRFGLDTGRRLLHKGVGFGWVMHVAAARRRLARDISRAGWHETPERVVAMASAMSLCLGALGAAVSPEVAVLGFLAGYVMFAAALNAALERRRRRFSGELVPLLELFTLELSGGGSALAALGSVCVQVESELASDLRRMLIASQVAGSASFEARLIEYADQHEIAALSSLATILAASRDYGSAASQGVRALATDLRRAQRRELIAQSRRALNNVLLPAAVAVLLPFLGVLMFPAVSVLQKSLH
jgi:Flp pilus assembly protein TadB